jgi:hypothetical protein
MDENPFAPWPHLVLEQAGLSCVVLLPDPLQGYYRGPRFDWAGTVAFARSGGHTFFGPWRDEPHRPRLNDDTVGTAGEFGMGPLTDNPAPLGYAEAAVGESCLKIGVGSVVKAADEAYSFAGLYRIAQPASWDIRREGGAAVRFTTEQGPLRGYAVRYEKTVSLHGGALTVSHTLENTGELALSQTHYCHNFTVIDGQRVGGRYSLELPFRPRLTRQRGGTLAVDGSRIVLERDPAPTEQFFAVVTGYDAGPGHNRVVVRCGEAALAISGDAGMVRLQVWGNGRTICPEPFVSLELAPGECRSWSIRYELAV